MKHFPPVFDGTDTHPDRVIARANYIRLRNLLVALQSASAPNQLAIDNVIRDLEEAQLAYKATHGLVGNNPIEDKRP